MLDTKKVRLIAVARSQLGLDDDSYREILAVAGGVTSLKDLDDAGFQAVMQAFEDRGFRSSMKKRDFGERAGMATPKQVEFIRMLWSEYTGRSEDDAALGKWLERKFGVSALRFLPIALAPKVITALKAMKARKTNATGT